MATDTGNGRAVTLDQVARAAGVSRATVSRVVNGNPKVAPNVRKTVQRAVERLGYVPNRAARSLVTRRSDSVGLVIAEPAGRLFEDPFFPRLLRQISAELSAHELQLVLLMPQSTRDEHRIERYLAAGHVDGALLVSLHGDDPLPSQLAAHGLPVVVGGRPPRTARVSFVDVDNVQGARSAVDHLVALGRQRIGTITGPVDMPAGLDRLTGYRDGLRAAGIAGGASLEERGDFTLEGGEAATQRLLAAHPDVDGLFVASDLMAVGALRVLRGAGRRVPQDVAVVGFDDSVAPTLDPPLTSVRQPIEEMGREMVRLLIDQVAQPSPVPRRVILDTRLVIRHSTEGGPPG
ncbi:MAG TPA: LacI family DNA-binding transcriptional regulator [Vitreimonas sp.]|nr:LacI family DNA-binding transcriptional regulator [Vitreimonas sp.]